MHWNTSQEKYRKQILSLLPWSKGEKQGYEKQNSFNINFFLRFRFGRGLSSS
ncbi:hypothetical protein BYT27DRAFT_7186398, partial [Phlegmacium glaucopus]